MRFKIRGLNLEKAFLDVRKTILYYLPLFILLFVYVLDRFVSLSRPSVNCFLMSLLLALLDME